VKPLFPPVAFIGVVGSRESGVGSGGGGKWEWGGGGVEGRELGHCRRDDDG
jgi:hypothetical protein